MTADPPDFLDSLSLDALLASPGKHTTEYRLSVARSYTSMPRLDRSGAVLATIVLESPGGDSRSHSVKVGASYLRGQYTSCALCGEWGGCEAAAGLLVDLAASEALRAALRGHGSVSDALERLPDARERARLDLVAHVAAFQWFDLPPSASVEVEYLLAFSDSASVAQRFAAHAPGVPYAPAGRLSLRVRSRRSKRSVAPTDPWHHLLGPGDRAVLELCEHTSWDSKVWTVNSTQAAAVLDLLRDRPHVFVGDEQPVHFSPEALSLRLVLEELACSRLSPAADAGRLALAAWPARASGTVRALVAHWASEGGEIDVAVEGSCYLPGARPQVWLPRTHTVHPVDPLLDPDAVNAVMQRPAAEIPAGREAMIFGALKGALRGRGVQIPERAAFGLEPERPADLVVYIEGSPLDLRAQAEVSYEFGKFALQPEPPEPEESDRWSLARTGADCRRDPEAEAAACAELARAGLRWDAETAAFVGADSDAAFFWQHGAAQLRAHAGHNITLMVPEYLRATHSRSRIRASLSADLLGDGINAALQFDAEGIVAGLSDILKAIAAKRRWIVLGDGSIAEVSDAVAELADDACDVLPARGEAVVEPFHLGRLDRWAELADEARFGTNVEALRSKLRTMAADDEPELPSSLRASLRPYQRQGVAWLQFLDTLGAGGILADDMGLGKTVMTLALLLWRQERDGTRPSLVVCPRSVVGNWLSEAERFTPSLRTAVFDGAVSLGMLENLDGIDIIVTSYGLLRRYAELLARCELRYAILDEAQNIKTSSAQTTRAASMLRAERRLSLTGTPVENHLLEFWSILDFVNPNMLGTAKEFERRFARAIEENPGGQRAIRLRGAVRPFVLRRTKTQVLADLPPMQEIDLGCPLTTAQRSYYDKLAQLARSDVRALLREQGFSRSHVNVLAALLRLRQCALDPRLVDDQRPAADSGKRAAFLELVRNLCDEGRRALVFSQFVSLLSLWRQDLDREGIAYEYLDGSTQHREQVVERFQQGSAPLFLISLKAGGAGLNLTAADTVILCDPWWNPAAEDQAAGRAHRIGQTRAVTVIRLVAKGTIEDKIQVLKDRKRAVADALLAHGDSVPGSMTEQDLDVLLGNADSGSTFGDGDDETAESGSVPPPPESKPSPPSLSEPDHDDRRRLANRLASARTALGYLLQRTDWTQKRIARETRVPASQLSLLRRDKLRGLAEQQVKAIERLAREEGWKPKPNDVRPRASAPSPTVEE